MTLTTFLSALLIGLIPSLIWLFFWLREDNLHPEPRILLISTFLGGMIVVILAIFGEKYAAELITDQFWRYTVWAAIEEVLKFLVIICIALNTDYNDEPIDAMIYAISVALGFAALENALFIMAPLAQGEIARSILTENMRFLGATLVHVVSSACVGFAIGVVFYRGIFAKMVAGAIGLSAAIALHAAFNLSIISSAPKDTLKTFGWVWLAAIILIILFEEIKAVRPGIKSRVVRT